MTIMMNPRFFSSMAAPFGIWDTSDAPTATNRHIRIYKGTIPTDADDYDENSATFTVNELANFNNFIIEQNGAALRFQTTGGLPNPSSVNATADGTASWYAMYMTTGVTRCILGDVTLAGGTGSMQLDSLDLLTGNPTTILGWGIEFTA